MNKIGSFFKEVHQEMKAVDWADGQTLRKNTVTVFVVIALFAIFFMGIDYLTVTLLSLLS